jgi:hypothetical protein
MYSALGPASAAIYALLRSDATLAALLTGGWGSEIPQGVALPCGLYEVQERDVRGFGMGGMPEIDLITHVFSQRGGATGGLAQAQEANRLTVGLLKDAAMTVAGYAHCGRVVYHETIQMPVEELNGVPVHEVVSNYTIWLEEV